MKPLILLADDHKDFRESIAGILRRSDKYELILAEDGAEAVRIFEQTPDLRCVLLDYHMPGMTGLEAAAHMHELAPHIPVVLMSSYEGAPQGWVQEKADSANVSFIGKNSDAVLKALASFVYVDSADEPDEALQERLRALGFEAGSASMKRLIIQAARAADSGLNVLVGGETGVGKTWLARTIHALSNRAAEPFVVFACSDYAANRELFAANVFGHRKGAFTGAATDKRSLFEEAGNGTLFLDEISEIPPEAQATLLRALDDRTYTRMGESRELPIHCRIISATNRNLAEAVAAREFREDLMRRLQQEHLHLPPLRERRDDIPLIVRSALREFAAQEHGRRLRIGKEAIDYLKRQQWPGNVRQLRNTVLRVLNVVSGDTVSVADFYPAMRQDSEAPVQVPVSASPPSSTVTTPVAAPLPSTVTTPATTPLPSTVETPLPSTPSLEDIVREAAGKVFAHSYESNLKDVVEAFRKCLIEESLRRTYGNIKEAERRYWGYAETGRGGLNYQISKLGIDVQEFR